jgi:hypothetical protein
LKEPNMTAEHDALVNDWRQNAARQEDRNFRFLRSLKRGVAAPVTAAAANQLLGPTLGQFRGLRKFTYPVCLFLFTLRQEQAFFSWLHCPHRLTHAKCGLTLQALSQCGGKSETCQFGSTRSKRFAPKG